MVAVFPLPVDHMPCFTVFLTVMQAYRGAAALVLNLNALEQLAATIMMEAMKRSHHQNALTTKPTRFLMACQLAVAASSKAAIS